MSTLTGARLVGTFDPLGSEAPANIEFQVIGLSFNVEDRAQIDVTAGDDDTQHAIPGRKGITTASISARIPGTAAGIQLHLDPLVHCGTGTLVLKASPTTSCAPDDMEELYNGAAWMMSYSTEASLDSSIDVTMNFLLDVANES